MPRGMKVPVSVGPHGGSVPIEGSIVINQNVILGLTPAGSLHPFHQDITPDENFIFEIRDVKTGGLYTTHVRKFFSEMETMGYARLFPGSRGLSIQDSGNPGEMVVTVRYVNLETNSEEKLEFPIRGGEMR